MPATRAPRSPGRPPLPPDLRRTARVTVRLTTRERAALEAAAAARGEFLPAYIRRCCGLPA